MADVSAVFAVVVSRNSEAISDRYGFLLSLSLSLDGDHDLFLFVFAVFYGVCITNSVIF